MAIGSMLRPRWLPEKSFPPYAYLPGTQPHPVRDPTGHSYHVEPLPVAAEASLGSDVFSGVSTSSITVITGKLMRPGRSLAGCRSRRPIALALKVLILLSAAGVKIHEGKHAAAVRHAGRAATLYRRLVRAPDRVVESALGVSPATLADYAEAATRIPAAFEAVSPDQPQPVFDFILGLDTETTNSRAFPDGEARSPTLLCPSGAS